jgi:NitT/TauT family transport system ATP-binding protein
MTLRVENLSVTYETAAGRKVRAVENTDLTVQVGEFVSLIGPSGCGKSTLLHCIGGLLPPTTGTVKVGEDLIRDPKPKRAAFVFQDYSLYPWRSVVDNAAIGLRFAGVSKAERRERAMAELELVGLAHVAESYPSELSGGMQQRVAVARALAMQPEILLMDEPFGALDEQSRRRLGIEMSRVLTDTGKTVIMVTHSLDEAIFWGDRVLVMSKGPGRIIEELHVDEPRPRRAEFMTEPAFDRLRARLFGLLEVTTSETRPSAGVGAPTEAG